jgi:hypothetical protein
MLEPETTNLEITDFKYDDLYAGETLTLSMDMDFSNFDFSSGEKYLAFVFKILDGKQYILGDAKRDNLIVFIKVKQESEPSDDHLLGIASVLMDEGYSQSFDRCLKATRACNGDVQKARDLLSKVMITENQYS